MRLTMSVSGPSINLDEVGESLPTEIWKREKIAGPRLGVNSSQAADLCLENLFAARRGLCPRGFLRS